MWINVEGQLLLMCKSKFSRLTGSVHLMIDRRTLKAPRTKKHMEETSKDSQGQWDRTPYQELSYYLYKKTKLNGC
jgi:hypothetical protein